MGKEMLKRVSQKWERERALEFESKERWRQETCKDRHRGRERESKSERVRESKREQQVDPHAKHALYSTCDFFIHL